MQLLDDHLFRLWKDKKVAEDEVLYKAQQPDDLIKRINDAKKGIFENEEEISRRAQREMNSR
jgi:twitching motility protein PilT